MDEAALPAYRKPPVVETVLGVQFHPVRGFTNAHLGAFWKWLLAESQSASDQQWPTVVDAPPIEPAFERFEEDQVWSPDALQIRVRQSPGMRLQIRNSAGDAMIQVQSTRLHYNWIGQSGTDYRRYKKVRPEFDRVYEIFRRFLAAEKLGAPDENQWEVTYVNHIPTGTTWNSAKDWAKLFTGLPGPWVGSPEVRPESVGGAWHFEIPPQRGRLHVELKHARPGGSESDEILRLTLTARGPIGDGEGSGVSISDGLDLGRRTIVQTFTDITSTEAHKIWERIR